MDALTDAMPHDTRFALTSESLRDEVPLLGPDLLPLVLGRLFATRNLMLVQIQGLF